MAERRLWYAGYGSNLLDSRLTAYLHGGRPPGSTRDHPGSRDPRPPAESRTCTLSGRVSFRGHFDAWGEVGGAAFLDIEGDSQGAWARAHRVTLTQLVDLALQENGFHPHSHGAGRIGSIADSLATLDSAEANAEIHLAVEGPYDLALAVPATFAEGEARTVITLTNGDLGAVPETQPPVAYLRVIIDGLCRDAELAADEAIDYLHRAGVDRRLLASIDAT